MLRRDERADTQQARRQPPAMSMRTTLAAHDWVDRIVALVRAGRREDAERELRAFRDAYGDADERLPAELRAWAASVPRTR
jgi:hypothetical protein